MGASSQGGVGSRLLLRPWICPRLGLGSEHPPWPGTMGWGWGWAKLPGLLEGAQALPAVWNCGLLQNAVMEAGSPLTNERRCTRGTTVQASDNLLSSADTPVFHVSPSCPHPVQTPGPSPPSANSHPLPRSLPLSCHPFCAYTLWTESQNQAGGTTVHSASQSTWQSTFQLGCWSHSPKHYYITSHFQNASPSSDDGKQGRLCWLPACLGPLLLVLLLGACPTHPFGANPLSFLRCQSRMVI